LRNNKATAHRDVSTIEDRRMYKLYSMQRSGNSYKVRLALALLNAP
jgi:glutathione S-transferase